MRLIALCLWLASGCTQRYFVPDAALGEYARTPPESRDGKVVAATRANSDISVRIRPSALSFGGGVNGGRLAYGRRLHPITSTGIAIAAVGALTLLVGGVTFALASPSVNPDVARCISGGGWFCGLGEAVGGAALMGWGLGEIVIGGGMALGTLRRREAETIH